MSLPLYKLTPNFQTIQEIPGIERRPRSWREKRSRNGPLVYMIVRWKPEQVFVFRVLSRVNLKLYLLTKNFFEEKILQQL